jgi:hypothetical protein
MELYEKVFLSALLSFLTVFVGYMYYKQKNINDLFQRQLEGMLNIIKHINDKEKVRDLLNDLDIK